MSFTFLFDITNTLFPVAMRHLLVSRIICLSMNVPFRLEYAVRTYRPGANSPPTDLATKEHPTAPMISNRWMISIVVEGRTCSAT
jgi:hypothetical protein